MKLVILTNDNFFSYTILKKVLEKYKEDLGLVVFSSAVIGKRGPLDSILWSLKNTGFRHTLFKLTVYGLFRSLKYICSCLLFMPNHFSTLLWVQKNKIPHVISPEINSEEVFEEIESASPDLIISVSMNQIVKDRLLTYPPNRCINIHCSPLPKYAGMSPYVWTLANCEQHSAVTIHYMEKGVDEGDILSQERVPVVKDDSAFALFYRCCLKAGKMLDSVVMEIADGTAKGHPQDLTQKTYFSWPTKKCVKNLHRHGYKLAYLSDFLTAIFLQKPRV